MSVQLEQEARIALLRDYYSKSTAHGTNLLTIAIGFFAYVEIYKLVIASIMAPWPPGIQILLNSIILSGFTTITIHQILRLLEWSRLTQKALDEETDAAWLNGRNNLHRLHSHFAQVAKVRFYRLSYVGIIYGVIFLVCYGIGMMCLIYNQSF